MDSLPFLPEDFEEDSQLNFKNECEVSPDQGI
jgi:hypothetical protein